MSHDNHGHDNHGHDDHGHEHGSEHIFFDEGGVAGVGFIYVIIALGLVAWMLFCG